jgi:acetolactate synthase-1/2/3 large subunit
MKGAEALIHTLVASGVEVCFGNPGTSEMHFVASIDKAPQLRNILCLAEGVVTGAAAGYGRVKGVPAATLLHLGIGFANGIANLQNGLRADAPIVNIIGDHATFHPDPGSPLGTRILEGAVPAISGWMAWPRNVAELPQTVVDAVVAARGPGTTVATIVLPADVSWSDGAAPGKAPVFAGPRRIDDTAMAEIERLLRSDEKCMFMLGGKAQAGRALRAVSRIAQATGVDVITENVFSRIERGAGVPSFDRLNYRVEGATAQMKDVRHLILLDASAPVLTFGYPDTRSELTPEGCNVIDFGTAADDIDAALEQLADRLAPGIAPVGHPATSRDLPTGALNGAAIAQSLTALMPEDSIVVDSSVSMALGSQPVLLGAARHDWMTGSPGGAIGGGLPCALGAAIAAPDRRVIALEADGSGMYNIQTLWTMARENVDVTMIILNNRAYAILKAELERVGANQGPGALSMLDLSTPPISFVDIARGMGVDGRTVATAEELNDALASALKRKGPYLIEALL